MKITSAWKYSMIGLVLILALACIWYLTRDTSVRDTAQTGDNTTPDLTTGTTEQLKLFLPAEDLAILDQSPLAGLEDLSTTLVSTSIELDLN